jgi:peptide subunit release factor 1 (eRF1)
MYCDETNYGIVLISGNGFMFYKLVKSGSHVDTNCIYNSTVKLQKRQKKGGQSAPRIERLREEKEHIYIKKVSEKMIDTFMIDNKTKLNVDCIIVGGPAQMKQKVIDLPENKKMLGHSIKKVVDTAEINNTTVWNVYEKCIDIITNNEENDAIILIQDIKNMMNLADNRLIYGINDVINNLQSCSIQKLLISSNIDSEIKKNIFLLNTYGCIIIETNPLNYKSIGIDIIGIKWY